MGNQNYIRLCYFVTIILELIPISHDILVTAQYRTQCSTRTVDDTHRLSRLPFARSSAMGKNYASQTNLHGNVVMNEILKLDDNRHLVVRSVERRDGRKHSSDGGGKHAGHRD